MNNHNKPISDIQSNKDMRNIPINRVGIKDIQHPVILKDLSASESAQHSVGTINMYVDLPADRKGTHMSRFIEILNESPLILSMGNASSAVTLLDTVATRLGAKNAFFECHFPYFVSKKAPISKVESLLDYQVSVHSKLENNQVSSEITVVVPVTSLCPCSKDVSDYGAHNQRSHVTVTVELDHSSTQDELSIAKLIRDIEQQASCELYGLLKRPDEKYVTERAYENPKFVEDMVRDVAGMLNQYDDIKHYRVQSENFESIHNHSAYAEIVK